MQFRDFANQIISVATTNGGHIFEQYRGLSRQITSNALGYGQRFPFVTIPRFESQCQLLGASTGAILIGFYPLVAEEQHDEWIEYSLANKGQLDEAFRLSGSNETAKVNPYIWDLATTERVNDTVNGFFSVGWQFYPIALYKSERKPVQLRDEALSSHSLILFVFLSKRIN